MKKVHIKDNLADAMTKPIKDGKLHGVDVFMTYQNYKQENLLKLAFSGKLLNLVKPILAILN